MRLIPVGIVDVAGPQTPVGEARGLEVQLLREGSIAWGPRN